jgi:tetratricopeptide (TPR) repeat protein/predicted Ser/Thr protein kinase
MSDSGVTPTMPEDVDAPPSVERGASIGRFLVLGSLGAGGMGVVLSAYDPELDRKVALKLLRGDVWRGDRAEAGRETLRREAQAMARLQHPNVVAVYEVAFSGPMAYVVMEQVVGQTLRDWLDEHKRPWPDIVDMVVQAGEGLAAAHRAGVTHRDFKPHNVLVGNDGRPRVTDFGLASVGADERAGTPAYMAPEQAAGERADERADQYAYCVTLWEALHEERPAPDPPPPRDRRAPAWLDRALARGLARRPEDRWPSMDALLGALRRQAPRRWLVLVGAVVAVGATAFVIGRQAAAPPACSGGEAIIAPVWDDAARARVGQAFDKTGRPYARDTFARVDAALRGRVVAWAGAHRDACEATAVRHEQSDTLLDRRMRCLARARAEIEAIVSLLGGADVATLDRATHAASDAGNIAACADVVALARAVPPPSDPATAAKVDALGNDVARLTALRVLGKWKEGLQASRDVAARARAIGYTPTLARAVKMRAGFDLLIGDVDAGIEGLYEAARLASSSNDDMVVVGALDELVFALGSRKQRFEAADVAYRLAAAAIARTGNDPRTLLDLYAYRANVLYRKGDYLSALAMRYLTLELIRRYRPANSPELASHLSYTAAVLDHMGRGKDAAELYRQSVAEGERTVGPEHPTMAILLNNFASNRLNALDFDAAASTLERVLAIEEKDFPPDDPTLAEGAHNLASARFLQRRLPEARALAERGRAIREKRLGPDHPKLGESYELLSLIARYEGHLDEAFRDAEGAVAILAKAYDQPHPTQSTAYRTLAAALVSLGRLPEARAAAERAIEVDKKTIGETNPDHADALLTLAEVLRAEGRFADAVPLYRRSLDMVVLQYDGDSPNILGAAVGLCDALAETGDGAGAVAACERAVAPARRGPMECAPIVAFELAKARWVAGKDRRGAMAQARDARAALAALPFPSEDLPRVDRWLAGR